MLITLEPCGKFCSNYFNIAKLLVAKRLRGITEHHFGRSSSFSENAHNSWAAWYIWFKFCILYVFNIVQPLVCNKGDKASLSIILAGQALLVKMLITLEQHGLFGSNFLYLCILTLSSHWYAKTVARLL